jgi:superfamily II DNA or RNA helicase
MKVYLKYNKLKIVINLQDFDNYDLQIITTVEKHFTIKYEIKLNGHVIINKQRNFKSKIKTIDNIKHRVISLPKFEGINYLQKILGKNFEYEDIRDFNVNPIEISSNITLYEKQNKICSYVENKLKKRKSNNIVLIALPGTGKTIMALDLLSRFKCKTIIILPNIYLLTQWKDSILDNFPNIISDDILIWNGTNKKNLQFYNNNFKIILTTIQTSIKIKNKNLINNGVKMTIYDEVHLYCSKCYSKTFWKTQTLYNIGLTANETNPNGSQKIFLQHLNTLTLASDIVADDAIQFNGLVTILKNKKKYENIINDDGNLIYAAILNNLVLDEQRNDIIIEEILKIYDENTQNYCFVFSDRIVHLSTLENLIKEKRNEIIVLTGGANNDTIDYANNKARVILTTYAYSAVGTNIPRMTNIILATPRKSNINQIIGRILRTNTDENNKKIRKIIDIVDQNSIFYNSSRERLKYYINMNFQIKNIDLKNK